MSSFLLTLFLCGDVMTGRGIDQALPHPGDPLIHEGYARSAELYVRLAERAHGAIPRPVDFAYIWGDALEEFTHRRPDARIINLETSITRASDHWRSKGINYRMHPANVPCLTVAGVDCAALANNHVLDYGDQGLLETLGTLRAAGIRCAGAGRNVAEARAPAVIDVPGGGRVLVFAFGTETSGIPPAWAATDECAGVDLLPDLSDETADRIGAWVRTFKRPQDVAVASIHWGANWGFDVPDEHARFAHCLVAVGVDLVHGHSSHHVLALDVFAGKLILYGCGDFLDDYEGIGGHEAFRSDLALMYFPIVDAPTGRLSALHMTPMQVRNFRLQRASRADAAWLEDTLDRESRRFGCGVRIDDDGRLRLSWA